MRIAIVGNFALAGKQTMAERALPLAEELAGRGHKVMLALPVRQDGDERGPSDRKGVIIKYARRPRLLTGAGPIAQTLSLFGLAARWHPDVVYCFKPIAYAGGVLAIFKFLRAIRLYRCGLVLDTDDWEGYGGWNELHSYPWWVKRVIASQERWSLRHADAVTVANQALGEMVTKVGARCVTYLPNATRERNADAPPPRLATPDSLGLAGRPVVLLYTRFVEFDPSRALAVVTSVAAQVPGAVLLVVGLGLNGEEERLNRLAAERGATDLVVQAGWVDTADLDGFFRSAHVAIYPMDDTLLNRTKCPAKLRDLLAAGVAVVADRVGQAAEYIDDGTTGVLVRAGDVSAMTAEVVALLTDAAKRRALGDAARDEFRERWTWRRWAPVAESVLESARDRSRAVAAGQRA